MTASPTCPDTTSPRTTPRWPTREGGTLRVHYLREGDRSAPVVLLMHGEPSWSYLYRKMIPVLTGAGLQIVAPDLVGFGRSDKPAERGDYTFARHVEWMRELLFDRLDLGAITLVGQDWGGLIGLRLVGEHPERFAGSWPRTPSCPRATPIPATPSSPGSGSPRRSRRFPPAASSAAAAPSRWHPRSRRPTTRPSPTSPTSRGARSSRCSCRPGPTTRPTTPTWRPGWAWPGSTGPSCVPSVTATPSPRGRTAASRSGSPVRRGSPTRRSSAAGTSSRRTAERSWPRSSSPSSPAHTVSDTRARRRHRRGRVLRHRDGGAPPLHGHGGLRRPRPGQRPGRHVAGQLLPGCLMRRALEPVLIFLRPQSRLVTLVLPADRDLGLPPCLRRPLRGGGHLRFGRTVDEARAGTTARRDGWSGRRGERSTPPRCWCGRPGR